MPLSLIGNPPTSMLPFFKHEGTSGNLTILNRSPDNDEWDEKEDLEPLVEAMRPLQRALESKDLRAMAFALRDAFDILETLSPGSEYSNNDGNEEGED